MTTRPRRRPSPAERAHLEIVRQERERLLLQLRLERRADEIAWLREMMEGDADPLPARLRNTADNWECCALAELNRERPPWRVAFQLPHSAYEARRLERYAL